MPPRPSDVYDPTLNVVPITGSPGGLSVRANPNAFGAQIGEAKTRGGAQLEQVDNRISDTYLQHQGMLNETMATNADTQYATQLGEIMGKYKSTTGLDTVAIQPHVVAQITKLGDDTLNTLPNPSARRAFSLLMQRRQAYALSEANEYGASQVKAAANKAASDSAELAVQQAGDPSVAGDDKKFGDILGDITHNSAWIVQNQGYGPGMKQDPQTGEVSFTDDDAGKMANSAYSVTYNKLAGDAWKQRVESLANEANGGNVLKAQEIFDANKDRIPAQARLDIANWLQPKVRNAQTRFSADHTLNDWDARYSEGVNDVANGQTPKGDIHAAIFGQESSSGKNPGTSVNGAVGAYQILPQTFAKYARAGEDINNPKDNAAVGNRIIDDLSQKYHGDAARVAVAYFSGEGNVAPDGSPTPWKTDSVDGNGKSVSSYVSDVQSRMGNGQGIYKSKADFYRANYDQIIQQTRDKAQDEHPDDPQYADAAVSRVTQRVNEVIRTQELQVTADNHVVYQAANGALSGGTPPASIDALRATSPEVAAAWDRLEVDNPAAAAAIQTKVLTANSKGKATTYGNDFYRLFRGVVAGENDPSRITDPTKLYQSVSGGPNAALTNTGLEALTSLMGHRNDPTGEANAQALRGFFQAAHSQISGANPATHAADPKGEALFGKFMMSVLPTIVNTMNSGKPIAPLLNPKSPDYIGTGIDHFKRPISQWMNDVITDSANPAQIFTGGNNAAPQIDTNTPDGLKAAVSSGKLSRSEGERIAISKGWAIANPPQVPRPE